MSVTSSDIRPGAGSRVRRSISELFGSMRFAISLLVIIAVASIIGTVIKQGDPYPNYVNEFGPFWADVFGGLSLYNIYGSWWFVAILAFLLVSVSLCLLRNAPRMIADMRSWRERVREGSLRAFRHHAEYRPAIAGDEAVARAGAFVAAQGYRYVVREQPGGTLIAAKRGAFTKIGYIFAHLAIVVICCGGLLDSGMIVRAQMWLFHKSAINSSAPISTIDGSHRLPSWNPSFRGFAWVPEGQYVSTAVLNQPDGTLVQDLPFSIELNKFTIDFYSTGMPKLFASDIVIVDHRDGKRTPARVEVNKPAVYDGVAIYQSSFEDGGSTLELTGFPMTGQSVKTFPVKGQVGGLTPLPAASEGDTIEFTGLRPFNVENVADASGRTDVRGVKTRSLAQKFDERLGSGAKTSVPKDLRNVGPSVQYKVRGRDGQAREYSNYMLPLTVDGARVFLAGMRASPDEPFRYLRIPADAGGTLDEWMRLRAALQDPALRAAAAQRFARVAVDDSNASSRANLAESAHRVLNLFAGAGDGSDSDARTAEDSGFTAIAAFIGKSVPEKDQEKAAGLLLRMLEGSMWHLWQLSREQSGLPELPSDADNSRFLQSSINALSDSFFYGAPALLQLQGFRQVNASVFQLTRSPGQKIVYLGSALLVLGIFAMFFIRERRLWIWVRHTDARCDVLMAMSTTRKTLDFEAEFSQVRDHLAEALDPAASAPSVK
jgi:cytochrome c biogenesis protein